MAVSCATVQCGAVHQNEAKPYMGACRSWSIPTLTSWPHRRVLLPSGGSTSYHHDASQSTAVHHGSSPSSPHTIRILIHSAFRSDSSIGHGPAPLCTFAACFKFSSTPASDIHPPTSDIPIIHHCAAHSTHPPRQRRSTQNHPQRPSSIFARSSRRSRYYLFHHQPTSPSPSPSPPRVHPTTPRLGCCFLAALKPL